jgi:hypothetical protein
MASRALVDRHRSHYVGDATLGEHASRIREGVRRSRHAMIREAGASHDAFPKRELGNEERGDSRPEKKPFDGSGSGAHAMP